MWFFLATNDNEVPMPKKNRFPTGKWKNKKSLRACLPSNWWSLRVLFTLLFCGWGVGRTHVLVTPGWEILLPFHRFFWEVLLPFHRFFQDHWLPSGKLQIWWTHWSVTLLEELHFSGRSPGIALRLLRRFLVGVMQNYTLFASKHQGWHFSHVVLQRWKNSFKLEKKEEYYV